MSLCLKQQYVTQKIKAGRSFVGVPTLRLHDGFMDVAAVAFGHLAAFVDVSPIHREAGNGLTNHVAQRFAGEVAGIAVGCGNGVKHVRQHIDLAGQRGMHDQLLAVVDHAVHIRRSANEPMVEIGKTALDFGDQ